MHWSDVHSIDSSRKFEDLKITTLRDPDTKKKKKEKEKEKDD